MMWFAVMNGTHRMRFGTAATLTAELLPLAVLVTPHIPDAQVLSGEPSCTYGYYF